MTCYLLRHALPFAGIYGAMDDGHDSRNATSGASTDKMEANLVSPTMQKQNPLSLAIHE